MDMYLGTKLIRARPALESTPLKPTKEDPLLQREPREGYEVIYADDYISWSPKDVFEAAYRRIDALTFGLAIEAMKTGHSVARAGWNGKGMFLYLVGSGRYPPSTPAGQAIAAEQPDGLVPYLPYIAMKTVQGDVVPWLASQTDILAEDWSIVS
jgi:hypothetical protein